jgi:hypothetical protein
MNGNPFKAPVLAFFMCLVILTGGIKSFAQSASPAGGYDNSSDGQASEENAQETLDQSRDFESKMQDELNRLDAMDQALNQAQAAYTETPAQTNTQTQEAPAQAAPVKQTPAAVSWFSKPLAWTSVSGDTFKISGEARAAMGINSNGGAIFTDANTDLDQKNWRILSSNGPNNNINTYDLGIYSELKVVMDASFLSSVVDVHLNLTADPWSYTGKSNTQLVTSEWGDTARVQYLSEGGTPYTMGAIVNTLRLGGSFAMPEVKIKDGIVPATSIASSIQNQNNPPQTDIFNVPAAQMDYTFQPVREAWVDIKPDDEFKLRIFPMAYENQALTTDDPLKLSNNMEWWAESPWIDGWQQGNFNPNGLSPDYTKGYWDKSLASLAQDGSGQHLTALRGVALQANPTDQTSFDATMATPKNPWQDYDQMNTLAGAARLKQFIGDLFYIGAVGDMHEGYDLNEVTDAENYVGAVDSGLMVMKWLKLNAEYATSNSIYDETSPEYTTKYNGNAYYVSLTTASNPDEEDILKKDYFGLNPVDKKEEFYKSTVYFARMDQGFESSLSDYNGTRADSFWADHLTFYPSEYRYLPGVTPFTSDYDMSPFAVGNGIDYGRSVVSWRADENFLEGKLQGLEDVRHVTNNNGQEIEDAYRVGATYAVTDKLTTKILGLWDQLPKTTAGVDPFLTVDNTASTPYLNTAVQGGQDPSLKTGSLGARYALTDWSAINGVWEYTNDFTLGSNDFPQGDLNSTYFSTYTQNGRLYTQEVPFLYDQGNFEQAPYPYYNIFKIGLELTPTDKWHIYLDYTRNPNKFAGNIDDNMNHYGIETSYVPTPKIGFYARYTLSQGYDINRLVNDNELDDRDYNNFFFEMRMILPKDVTMSLQYGVGPAYNVATSSTNPYLTYYSTGVLQTQHIVRIVFDKKF